MLAINHKNRWLAATALASVIFDALLMVIYAATVGWIVFAIWQGFQKLRGRTINLLSLTISISVPLLVILLDLAVQKQVDQDMHALSQSRTWENVTNPSDLLSSDGPISWVTKTRMGVIGFDGGTPFAMGRAFPGRVLKYNLESGEKIEYSW